MRVRLDLQPAADVPHACRSKRAGCLVRRTAPLRLTVASASGLTCPAWSTAKQARWCSAIGIDPTGNPMGGVAKCQGR